MGGSKGLGNKYRADKKKPQCPSCYKRSYEYYDELSACLCKYCGSVFTPSGELLKRRESPISPSCNQHDTTFFFENKYYGCNVCGSIFTTDRRK